MRAGVFIEAFDVDYPAGDEHDRVYINGHDIGLLEGRDESWQTREIQFPVSYLQEGANQIQVYVDELNKGWKVTIRASELYVYRSEDTPDPDTDTDPEPELVPSLEVIKRQSAKIILPGDEHTYDIIVTNDGQVTVEDITISDTLDAALEYLSDTSGVDPLVEEQTYTWELRRPLMPGQEFRFKIKTRISQELRAGYTITNMAVAESPLLEEPVWSEVVRANLGFISVPPDGLKVTKQVVPRNARIGKILTYRVAIANVARGSVFDVVLEDRLPQGVKFVPGKVLRDGRPYADPSGSRTLRWSIGTVLPGAATDLTYQVVVGTDAKRGKKTNTAAARGVDGGGNPVSGQAQAMFYLGSDDVMELGRIHVKAYHDRDASGFFNKGDEPVPGLRIILCSGGIKQTTDKAGETIFFEVKPNYHLVALDERTLPNWAQLAGPASVLVTLMEAETAEVRYPLISKSGARLAGRIFYDRNNDGAYQSGEALVSRFTVTVDGKLQTRGSKGKFTLTDLTPGTHTLDIEADGLQRTHTVDLLSGRNQVEIPWPYRGGIRIEVKEGQ